jgi:hypothetical protein
MARDLDFQAAYKKFQRGDPLESWELNRMIIKFEIMRDTLADLGPEWSLAWREAHSVYLRLADMKRFREDVAKGRR